MLFPVFFRWGKGGIFCVFGGGTFWEGSQYIHIFFLNSSFLICLIFMGDMWPPHAHALPPWYPSSSSNQRPVTLSSLMTDALPITIIFTEEGGRGKGQKRLRTSYRHNCSQTDLATDLPMVCKFKFVRLGHIKKNYCSLCLGLMLAL